MRLATGSLRVSRRSDWTNQNRGITPAILSVLFANATGRIVLDRTGLQGWFRVDLEWSPDQTATDKPSLFTAVQVQLGLKLDAARAPVDVLVVDHIERPSENEVVRR